MSRLPMVLVLNGVQLQNPPSVHSEPIKVQSLRQVSQFTNLDGELITRYASKNPMKITIELADDFYLTHPEYLQLKHLQVGDLITVQENYLEPVLSTWANCVISEEPQFPRKYLNPNDSTSPMRDLYKCRLVLTFQE